MNNNGNHTDCPKKGFEEVFVGCYDCFYKGTAIIDARFEKGNDNRCKFLSEKDDSWYGANGSTVLHAAGVSGSSEMGQELDITYSSNTNNRQQLTDQI